MSVLVVGLSHRSAPVELLERATLAADDVTKLLQDLAGSETAAEALVLSTCNRVEVYAEVERFHAGLAEVSELLAQRSGVGLGELSDHLYVHYEERAVAHLFSVACGLDSMVVGESQILGQVRTALRAAQDAGTAGRSLGTLAQQALRVGKRARTETGIDRAGRSLVTAGLEQAGRFLGPVAGRTAVVVGAGAMSSLSSAVLARSGAEVIVANRTLENAARVARSVDGTAVRLGELAAALGRADLLVSCTGAIGHVITTELVTGVQAARGHRPLVVLDLALPRDVEPGVRHIDGITVVDLERLAEELETSEHAGDVEATRTIVAQEVQEFLAWQRGSAVVPTVVALRGMAEAVVAGELARLDARLPHLDERTRAELRQTVQRVVDKVLHNPTVRVKQLAEEAPGQTYAEALRRLFDLDQAAIDAVTRADLDGEVP